MKIPLTAERPREPNTMPTPAITKAAEELNERIHAEVKEFLGNDQFWFGEERLREFLTRHFAPAAAPDDGPIDEAWLRSIGFVPKLYQGGVVLAMKMPNSIDHQWIETGPASESHGFFVLCRWCDSYSDDMPPDRVEVVAKTRSALLQLLSALNIPAPARLGSDVTSPSA